MLTAGTVTPRSVSRGDAARLLGVSIATFERRIQPELELVRLGRLRLVPVDEIDAWLARHREPSAIDQVKR